jgi:hypothetical protein
VRKELDKLQEENLKLRAQMRKMQADSMSILEINIDNFRKNVVMVEYYSGFTRFDQLTSFFEDCKKIAHPLIEKYRRMPLFTEFMMVLLQFRLGVTFNDVAARFKLEPEKAKDACIRWINGMYDWSKRHLNWLNTKAKTPQASKFTRMYGQGVVSVLDVFEVLIPKPLNDEACLLTWSPLRDHYTIKYLLSVTPQGKVNFLSDGWGGVVTDKQITEECGFLDFLDAGERVCILQIYIVY